MSIKFNRSFLMATLAGVAIFAQSCLAEDLGRYHAAKGVPTAVNNLGLAIARTQRKEVWPGHNENDCYTTALEEEFHQTHKLNGLVNQFRHAKAFAPGIAALAKLKPASRSLLLERWQQPNFLTWAENGHIGDDGTTDSGKEVEIEVASACVEVVKSALSGK